MGKEQNTCRRCPSPKVWSELLAATALGIPYLGTVFPEVHLTAVMYLYPMQHYVVYTKYLILVFVFFFFFNLIVHFLKKKKGQAKQKSSPFSNDLDPLVRYLCLLPCGTLLFSASKITVQAYWKMIHRGTSKFLLSTSLTECMEFLLQQGEYNAASAQTYL